MANQKKTSAPFSSGNRKRKKWTTVVIYLMILAMLLSVVTMGAGMFI